VKLKLSLVVVALAVGVAALLAIPAEDAVANRGDGALGTVYVISQGLYYDTFVSAQSLPPKGRFQLLVGGQTMWGPGDQGYVGGRWKIPNGDGTYTYLLCPLLGPGRTMP
jgi:hypothetical protein